MENLEACWDVGQEKSVDPGIIFNGFSLTLRCFVWRWLQTNIQTQKHMDRDEDLTSLRDVITQTKISQIQPQFCPQTIN